MANNTQQHILNTSANLLGFCLFVITSLMYPIMRKPVLQTILPLLSQYCLFFPQCFLFYRYEQYDRPVKKILKLQPTIYFYEEALVSFAVFIILIIPRKEYYVQYNPHLRYIGIQTTLLSILAILVYGIVGFYFLDKKHFDIDFSAARGFLYSINLSGLNLY